MFTWFKKNPNNQNEKFVSCEALNSRISFFGRKIAFCSNGNPAQNRAYPIIYDNINPDNFEKEFDINKLIKSIKENRKNLEKGIIPKSCEGCNNLDNYHWHNDISKLKNYIEYFQFSDWGLCNSKCIYCESWTNTKKLPSGEYTTKDGTKDTYLILPIIKQLIKKKVITKETTIDFAGGEPTLYCQFEEALSYFINFGIKKIYVFSNVIKYSPIIAEGIKNGIITLTVSVDAGSKEIHKKVKGVESYDFVYENLAKYASFEKFKGQVISKYVIVPDVNDSIDEISLWIDKSKQIGISKLILNLDNRTFEKEITDKELPVKMKKLTDFFIQKTSQLNIEYGLYSNIKFINNIK